MTEDELKAAVHEYAVAAAPNGWDFRHDPEAWAKLLDAVDEYNFMQPGDVIILRDRYQLLRAQAAVGVAYLSNSGTRTIEAAEALRRLEADHGR